MDSIQIKEQIASTFDVVSSRHDENRFFAISARAIVEMLPAGGVKTVLDVSTGRFQPCRYLSKDGIFSTHSALRMRNISINGRTTLYYSSIVINENLQMFMKNNLTMLHPELDQYLKACLYNPSKTLADILYLALFTRDGENYTHSD